MSKGTKPARFYNSKENELEDQKILAALAQAAKDYENGAILEARDVLADIVVAIDHFGLYN